MSPPCCDSNNPSNNPENCQNTEVQWSPRRHHASVTLTVDGSQYLYVMGGRARELVDYQEEKSVGGIIGPRISDPDILSQKFSTQRQASLYKSDVWRSVNGRSWELITPGCEAPQVKNMFARIHHSVFLRVYSLNPNPIVFLGIADPDW